MELLFILGLLAVLIILVIGALLFLQQRRSGTIRAVIRPRRPRAEKNGAAEGRTGER
ncbi:hypothetical protein BH24CHL6_BH24CHL6_07120 [soil metagenome]